MNHKPVHESLREQLKKIKAYQRSKATGETYTEALAAIKSQETL
jgi:hypothetical protein